MPARAPATLRLRDALTLGLAQGPTELLPVSSSAHTVLISRLAGSPYAELDAERRKSFELALHAGAGVALALDMRREVLDAALLIDCRRAAVIALSQAPAGLAGLALRRPIERRLGGPRSIAAGLALGGVAMALADTRGGGARRADEARAGDGLALGLAQAAALVPGVSRHGAVLTAARARGFARADAEQLSWHAALPVMLGASALEGVRLLRLGVQRREGATLAGGALAAFASTSLSARVLRRSARPLLPFALYRLLLAALLARPRRHKRAQ